jgi:hypothetical protein
MFMAGAGAGETINTLFGCEGATLPMVNDLCIAKLQKAKES